MLHNCMFNHSFYVNFLNLILLLSIPGKLLIIFVIIIKSVIIYIENNYRGHYNAIPFLWNAKGKKSGNNNAVEDVQRKCNYMDSHDFCVILIY